MDSKIRQEVKLRAKSCCEYCRIHEDDDEFAFHVEHVISLKHGGTDALNNLALSCQNCNLHKGSNLAGIDPFTGELAPLFNPRTQTWDEHFNYRGACIVGLTAEGRTTVGVLGMNDADRVELRSILGYADFTE